MNIHITGRSHVTQGTKMERVEGEGEMIRPKINEMFYNKGYRIATLILSQGSIDTNGSE